MNPSTDAFVQALVDRFPALRPTLEEHLQKQDGELLPHVFLGDFTRWLVARMRTAGTGDRALLEILSFLEDEFGSGGDEVQEVIAVSFLENLPRSGEPGSEIRSLIGPLMQEELQKFG